MINWQDGQHTARIGNVTLKPGVKIIDHPLQGCKSITMNHETTLDRCFVDHVTIIVPTEVANANSWFVTGCVHDWT